MFQNFLKTMIATIIGFIITTSVASAKECGDVSITEMDWASSAVVTAVSKFLMERGYGCKVTVVPSSTTPALASLAEKGEPDIVTELWVNSAPAYHKLVKSGKIIPAGKVLSDGGVESWWIPAYLAKQHPELKTIEGILKNPKLVGGMFHNCPDGWGCKIRNDNVTVAYQLEKNGITVFTHGSGETLAASIASAYADKKPWFGYYWAPTAILGKYPMVKVKMAPFDKKIHACNVTKDCKTPGKSEFPASLVFTVVTKKFSTSHPDISKLMQNVSFSNTTMGKLLAWKTANNASNEETAVYFIQKHKKTWKRWINAKAKKKLAKLL